MIWRGTDDPDTPSDPPPEQPDTEHDGSQSHSQVAEIGRPFAVRSLDNAQPARQKYAATHGRRTRQIDTPHGHTVRAERPRQPLTTLSDIALNSTLHAVAKRHVLAGITATLPLRISSTDIRRKVREAKVGNLILFVVDGSGSMGAQKRMTAVKGAIFSLLLDAYQKRDQVGLILFRGAGAQLLLSPTNSVDKAQKVLARIPTGGRTPLAQGLSLAADTLQRYTEKAYTPLLVVVSDGRANVPIRGSDPLKEVLALAHRLARQQVSALVLDCETGRRRMGLARPLAAALEAKCIPLSDLSAEGVAQSVRERTTESGVG